MSISCFAQIFTGSPATRIPAGFFPAASNGLSSGLQVTTAVASFFSRVKGLQVSLSATFNEVSPDLQVTPMLAGFSNYFVWTSHWLGSNYHTLVYLAASNGLLLVYK
jgi:hypothetical protein